VLVTVKITHCDYHTVVTQSSARQGVKSIQLPHKFRTARCRSGGVSLSTACETYQCF